MKCIDELGISPTPWEVLDDGITVTYPIEEGVDGEVAYCNGGVTDIANACLIAAAPELYEYLRESIECVCAGCPRNPCESSCKAVAKWRAALAKAAGEEEAQ